MTPIYHVVDLSSFGDMFFIEVTKINRERGREREGERERERERKRARE